MAHVLRGARDGHPVQRRVSYRRLRDGDSDSGGESHDENSRSSGGYGLVTRQVLLSASPTVPSAMHDADDDDHRAEDDEDISLYASLVTPKSIWHEIWLAMRHGAWFIFLSTAVATLACFVAVVRHTSHENGTGAAETPSLPARHVPSAHEQQVMHGQRMEGATKIDIGQDTVVLQGGTAAAGKQGHMRLPDQFYQGLHLGLSGWDEWGVRLRENENKARNAALRQALRRLDPKPTAIYATTFEGGVEGFTVAFIAGDLSRTTERDVHSRKDPVWKAAEQSVLDTARLFRQLVIMKWYPKVWGPGHESDKHLHTSVLQEVLPTRTGLRRLASTVAVYRVHAAVAVNNGGGGSSGGSSNVDFNTGSS